MRVRKVVLYLLPLLAVFFVWIGSRENVIGAPLDTLFGPLLDIKDCSFLHSSGLSFSVESPMHFYWRVSTDLLNATVVPRRSFGEYHRCRYVGALGNRTLLLGFHMAFPDFVIPFLLRIPITESTFYIYSSAYLAMISLSALGGAEIVRAVFIRIE